MPSDNRVVGLAINPGVFDITVPSADELVAMRPNWVRFLITKTFQDFQTGQNTDLDRLIARCRDRGIQILALISAESVNETLPLGDPEGWGDADSGYIGSIANLAQRVSGFYSNQIGAIEIINEPDNFPIVPEDYAAILVAAHGKIKTVSALPVISGGICCGDSFEYLRRVLQAAPNACDGVGWHPYARHVEGFPAPDWGSGDLRASLTRAREIAGKPLWVTEIGAALKYQYPQGMTPEAAVSEYLQRTYDLARELGSDQVARVFWFTWKDFGGDSGYGLVDDAGFRRPAWYAFQQQSQVENPTLPGISFVNFTPVSLQAGQLLNFSVTVRNNSAETLPTQGPLPGFEYEEGDSFYTRGFPDVSGAYRVGLDFDGRTGIDHPFRWGLGSPLAPGEKRVINGSIRLKTAQAKNYWAGLVREQIAWLQDHKGDQTISVSSAPSAPPRIDQVTFTLSKVDQRDVLNVSIQVTNASNDTLVTQGPEPGLVYDEGDTFYTRNFPETPGAFRVGVDFDNRVGIDHPYRWGLGVPLTPGETRVINGSIRLKYAQSRNYWVGLVDEQVAWLQDRQGVQKITVGSPLNGTPQIVSINYAPTTLVPNELFNVSITVRNDSNQTLQTQGPEPGFIYEEGDSFETRGFPAKAGAYRVGIDFDGRVGIDHPYRWGLGAPLAPGESRVINGAIRLTKIETKDFWVGLVQELNVWLLDNVNKRPVSVLPQGAASIVSASLSPSTLNAGDALNVRITVKNNSSETLATQGPAPGFIYEEGESFYTVGSPDVAGAFRVGVDFDTRTGIDHPYRWGLGAPLAPGESREVTGAIVLKHQQAQNYWTGLVNERIAWLQEREGLQKIQVAAGLAPRVVHVHDDNATTWTNQLDYWNFVNQDVVNEMFERGMTALTGASTLAEAWSKLLPHYAPGQGIALKINFTNSGAPGKIDSVPQTINAIVRGLKQMGVQEGDLWLFDNHNFVDYYVSGIQFPGIKFFDVSAHHPLTFNSDDPNAVIEFSPPSTIPLPDTLKLADVLLNATYLINLPILKGHYGGAGVTLGFKNHMGSTSHPPTFHAYIWPAGQYFRNDYNALVDLNRSPHIRNKTILTIGEGLFTGDRWNSAPLVMKTFGNKTPNSFFFSTDPVAIDSVMCDFVDAEWHVVAGSDNYLRLASNIGMGVYERGDPLGAGYKKIEYKKI